VGTELIYRMIERPMIARGRRAAARIMAGPEASNDQERVRGNDHGGVDPTSVMISPVEGASSTHALQGQ
jgi:hypothetical protein